MSRFTRVATGATGAGVRYSHMRAGVQGLVMNYVRLVKRPLLIDLRPLELLEELSAESWEEAAECFCFLGKVHDMNWLSECHRTKEVFEASVDGTSSQFGTEMYDHPISTEDNLRLRQFGTNTLLAVQIRP